ncbi:MAG: hypothetical protein IT372_19060 [Polyangiaceae bacterium]|nr:hypothetical protein [Polyangiaceae bacterium]
MASPYRIRPKSPPPRTVDRGRLRTETFAFGFLCVIFGAVLSGADRARCAFLATLGGVALLVTRPRTL